MEFDDLEIYHYLTLKVKNIIAEKEPITTELMNEIKEYFEKLSEWEKRELAYQLALICLRYDLKDFWYFADHLRKTVWFNKLMGYASTMAYKKGKKYDPYIQEGKKNTKQLQPGYKAIGYLFLAEFIVRIDKTRAMELIEEAVKKLKHEYDDIISGVVLLLSKTCLTYEKTCPEKIKLAVNNLTSRKKLSPFEKVDILTYISELLVDRLRDFSIELLDNAIEYYAEIKDPELKGIAILMIRRLMLILEKKHESRIKKYEKHEDDEIRKTYESTKGI